jgi:hypothetical protein
MREVLEEGPDHELKKQTQENSPDPVPMMELELNAPRTTARKPFCRGT